MKRADIENLLPDVFQRALSGENTPLGATLDIMEALHADAESVLENLEVVFDPYRCSDRQASMLAYWCHIDRLVPPRDLGENKLDWSGLPMAIDAGHLRNLVRSAAWISKWRGTNMGLTEVLETATGVRGFEVSDDVSDEHGQPIPMHIRISVPAAAASQMEVIEQIVASEKPVHVTHDFE